MACSFCGHHLQIFSWLAAEASRPLSAPCCGCHSVLAQTLDGTLLPGLPMWLGGRESGRHLVWLSAFWNGAWKGLWAWQGVKPYGLVSQLGARGPGWPGAPRRKARLGCRCLQGDLLRRGGILMFWSSHFTCMQCGAFSFASKFWLLLELQITSQSSSYKVPKPQGKQGPPACRSMATHYGKCCS